jgi:hypothetical protein
MARPGPGSLSEEAAVSFAPELGVPPIRRRRCGLEAEAELGTGERSRRSRGGEAAEECSGIGGRGRGAPAAALRSTGGRPPDGEADRGRHVGRSAELEAVEYGDAYRCTYAKMWIAVKSYWALTLQSAEKTALQTMLNTCTS